MGTEGQVVLPSQFGRYTLIERLATGGMAEVFRAKIVSSHGFEKIIVIKRILPNLAADPTFVTMFIDEAKLTAQLSHPKIVQVLDFGEVAGQYFSALEFIDGTDALGLLRASAKSRVRIPLPLVVFVMAQILDALDYAQSAPDSEGRPMLLVHRDISPSNIFISRHGDVKLGDFGIAHVSDRQSKTQVGTLKGKYGYMSPEQVIGAPLDGRSDLFSVGIVMAEAFMGRRLFTAANDLDVLLMVRDGRLERLNRYAHDVPPELNRIVRKALKREVEGRYQTAAEFRDDLSDYLLSHKMRIGPADLRAFMNDLFDPSSEALERVHRAGRPLAEPISNVAIPTVAPHGAHGGDRTPISPPPTGLDRESPSLQRSPSGSSDWPSGSEADARRAPARSRGVDAGASAHAELPPQRGRAAAASSAPAADPAPPASPEEPAVPMFSVNDLALIDLDQWDTSGPQPSAAGTPDGTGRLEPSEGRDSSSASSSARKLGGGGQAPPGVGAPFPDVKTDVGRFISTAPARPPETAGKLGVVTPMRVFANITVAGETGLLRFERDVQPTDGGVPVVEIKEVFLSDGAPESVNSSVADDRFGAYLVSRGVLRAPELQMALGMLPQFSGKLGDTLVAMGLMRPLDVFRQLSQQVRDRVIDLFRWPYGRFAFFRGVKNGQESFPLGLDGFEILGAGVLTMSVEGLERRFRAAADSRPRRTGRRQIDPDGFRLGPTPRQVLALLDGKRTLGFWMTQFATPDELGTFFRSLYLLVETDLAELG